MSAHPTIARVEVVPVAGHDSMLLNLSGAHAPFFTRNIAIVTDSDGRTGRRRCRAARRSGHDREAEGAVVGQPVARYRSLLGAVAGFAGRDAGGRGVQTFDLRTTVHAVTALESALLELHGRSRRARSRAARRRRPAGPGAVSATSSSWRLGATDLPYLPTPEVDGWAGCAASRR